MVQQCFQLAAKCVAMVDFPFSALVGKCLILGFKLYSVIFLFRQLPKFDPYNSSYHRQLFFNINVQ